MTGIITACTTGRDCPNRPPLMNAVTVLAALESLGLPLAESAIRDGLANARLAGRMQQLQTSPLVIVDVAHNPHSAAYLASQLRQRPAKASCRGWHAQDKDMAGSLAELDGLIDEWFPASLHGPRGHGRPVGDGPW